MRINIDNMLNSRNKTRYWLAKEIGFSYQSLMKLCNGQMISIKFEVLEEICKLLDCTPNDILILEEKTSKSE